VTSLTDARPAVIPAPLIVQQAQKVEAIDDDRESVLPGDPVVLIVEDDPHFGRVLLSMVRDKGFKGVVTTHGAHARSLTRQFNPLAINVGNFFCRTCSDGPC
jgi:Response regulator of citrate/malate metabolism